MHIILPLRYAEVIFQEYLKLILQDDILSSFCEIGLRWVPQNLNDDT